MSYNYEVIKNGPSRGVAEFDLNEDSVRIGTLYGFDQLIKFMTNGYYPGDYKDGIMRTLKWTKENHIELLI
jgi:hypothetical protein